MKERAVKINGKIPELDLTVVLKSLSMLSRDNRSNSVDECKGNIDGVKVNHAGEFEHIDSMHSFNIGNLGYSKVRYPFALCIES